MGVVLGANMAQSNYSQRWEGRRGAERRGANRSRGGEDRQRQGRKDAGDRRGYASPPAQRVWQGYDWAKGLQVEPVFTGKRGSAEQLALMNRHTADHNACVFLSLLSFLEAGDDPAFFERHQWSAVSQGELSGLLSVYSRMTRRRVRLHTLAPEGWLRTEQTIGRGDWTVHILVIPNGVDGLHCLPLGVPDFRATVEIPARVLGDIRADELSPPAPPAQAASGQASQPARRETADVATSSPPAEGKGGAAKPLAEVDDEFFDVRPARCGAPREEVDPFTIDGMAKLVDLFRGKSCVSYRGIQPLDTQFHQGVVQVEWRGGWFGTQCPKDPRIVLSALQNAILDVDFASATLDNFVLFGTRTSYVPVRVANGLHCVGRRTITDGKDAVEMFTAGDSIHVGDATWVVRQEGPVLKVTASNFEARVRGVVYAARKEAKVHPRAAELGRETRRKAEWAVTCLTNTDPVETAVLTRMRGDEAMDGYKGADAESSADLVRVLASRYRSAGNVSGPYAWGACYSCGSALQGKAKQRICRACVRHNSVLGRMVAEGCKVTSDACPIRYPGVVWTRSRHPPLKAGVQTVATERNFHIPRRA